MQKKVTDKGKERVTKETTASNRCFSRCNNRHVRTQCRSHDRDIALGERMYTARRNDLVYPRHQEGWPENSQCFVDLDEIWWHYASATVAS